MSNADERLEFTDNWVGVLPKGWTQTPLKYLVKYNSEVLPENTEPHYEFFYAEISDVHFSSGITLAEKIRFEDAPSRARRVVRHNDVLISTVRTYLRAIAQAPHIEDLVGSTGFCVLRSDVTTIEPRYLFYSVVSDFFVERVISQSEGVSYPAINPTTLVGLKTVVPPLDEQRLISRYLDKKTHQIDTLIQKIEKKIELLKEQQTSLINHYVTKGLDPNVEMKDSGVEWIGKIPKHWDVSRLASLGRFSKGKNITKDELVDDGEPVILYSHLYTTYERVIGAPQYFISSERAKGSTTIPSNTFLFTSSGELAEEIGKSALYLGDGDVSVGGDLMIFSLNETDKLHPLFFSFVFDSSACQHQKSSMSRGEIVVHLYQKQLREVRVCIPPLKEQVEIARRLELFESNARKLLGNLMKRISLLQEYRQSLISSVVTGKVRVTEDMI